MNESETAARAAAYALGLNGATEWQSCVTVAQAVITALDAHRGLNSSADLTATSFEHLASLASVIPLRADEPRTTSEEVASIAAKGLTNPKSLTEDEIQSVCASALVQR